MKKEFNNLITELHGLTQGFEIVDKKPEQKWVAEDGAVGRHFIDLIVKHPNEINNLNFPVDDQATFGMHKCTFFVDLETGNFEVSPKNSPTMVFPIDILGHESFDKLVVCLSMLMNDEKDISLEETTTTSSVGGQYSSKYFLDPNNLKGRKPLWKGGAIIAANPLTHEMGVNSFKVKKGVVEEGLSEINDEIITTAIEKGDITKLAHYYSKGIMADEIIMKATQLKGDVFANRIKVRAKESLNENDNIYNKEKSVKKITTKADLLKEWSGQVTVNEAKESFINDIIGNGEEEQEEIDIQPEVKEDEIEEGRNRKINQKEYLFYVVQLIGDYAKICEGFEYQSDAIDRAKEIANEQGVKKDASLKVVAKRALKKYNLNPDDNSVWADPQWGIGEDEVDITPDEVEETTSAGGTGGSFSKPLGEEEFPEIPELNLDEEEVEEGIFKDIKKIFKPKKEPKKSNQIRTNYGPDDEKALKLLDKLKADSSNIELTGKYTVCKYNGYKIFLTAIRSINITNEKDSTTFDYYVSQDIYNQFMAFFNSLYDEKKNQGINSARDSFHKELGLDEQENEDGLIDNQEIVTSNDDKIKAMYEQFNNGDLDDNQCFEMLSLMATEGAYPNEDCQRLAEEMFDAGFLNEDGSINEKALYGEEEMEEGTVYAGATSVPSLQKDPSFAKLPSPTKMNLQNKLKKGEAVSLGEDEMEERSHWNELVKFIDNANVSSEEKQYAQMLLSQLNTAGGARIKPEIDSFLDSNKNEMEENFSDEEIENKYQELETPEPQGQVAPEQAPEESDDEMFDRLLGKAESPEEWGEIDNNEDDMNEWKLNEDISIPGHVKTGLKKIQAANAKNEKDSEKESGFKIKHTNPQSIQFVEKLLDSELDEKDIKKIDNEASTEEIENTIPKGLEDLDYQNEPTESFEERQKNGIKPIIKSAKVKDQFGHVTDAMPHANVSDSSDKLGDSTLKAVKAKEKVKKEMPMYSKDPQPFKKINEGEESDDDIVKEGEDYVITRGEQKLINEEITRMQKLMGYNPKDILNTKANKTSDNLFKIKEK